MKILKLLKFFRNQQKTIDIGRFSVILNRENYLGKCMVYLNNGPYQLYKTVLTSKVKAKALKYLETREQIITDNQLYYYLKSVELLAPKFHSQPKNKDKTKQKNKPKVPLCLIISYTGSLLYNINKNKANILKAYIKDENDKVNNFTMFSNYIRNVSIEDDEIMASFDITFLQINIPIIDTFSIGKNSGNNDDESTRKTTLPQGY